MQKLLLQVERQGTMGRYRAGKKDNLFADGIQNRFGMDPGAAAALRGLLALPLPPNGRDRRRGLGGQSPPSNFLIMADKEL